MFCKEQLVWCYVVMSVLLMIYGGKKKKKYEFMRVGSDEYYKRRKLSVGRLSPITDCEIKPLKEYLS